MIRTLHATFAPVDHARRRWLTGAAALTGAATLTTTALIETPATAAPASHVAPLQDGFIHFADARARFRALFRFERDLRESGTTVSCYHFIVYALLAGQRPHPVVRYEGMEFSYFRRIAADTYRIHAHNVSFPRDLATGEYVREIVSPFDGSRLAVPSMKLLGDPGVLHGPRGYLPLDARAVRWLDTPFFVRVEGDLVKAEHIRPTPDGWPQEFIESSTSSVARRDFENPAITSLRYQTSGFYVFPFPKWMNLEGRAGHMLGAWSGRKLDDIAQLPKEFATRLRGENPELLQARWQEFDRPIAKELAAWTDA